MLFEVLLAWAISIGVLLGLFQLTEQIVQVNNTVLRLSIAAAHLRGIEGHWRLAQYEAPGRHNGEPLCSPESKVLSVWCNDWRELLVALDAGGTLHLEGGPGEYVVSAAIVFQSGTDPYRLSHRWSRPR